MKKNNFEEYGFKADFEGEILKELDDVYIGYFIKQDNHHYPCSWLKNGEIYDMPIYAIGKFNLTPIKKEWYEDKNNIGKLCITTNTKEIFIMTETKDMNCVGSDRFLNQTEFEHCDINNCRPATKEEILTLLINQ